MKNPFPHFAGDAFLPSAGKEPPPVILPLYDCFPGSSDRGLWLPEKYLLFPGGKYPGAQFIVRYASGELSPDIPAGSYLFLQNCKRRCAIDPEAVYYFASDALRGLCTAQRVGTDRIGLASLLTGHFCVILPVKEVKILCRVCAITSRL